MGNNSFGERIGGTRMWLGGFSFASLAGRPPAAPGRLLDLSPAAEIAFAVGAEGDLSAISGQLFDDLFPHDGA